MTSGPKLGTGGRMSFFILLRDREMVAKSAVKYAQQSANLTYVDLDTPLFAWKWGKDNPVHFINVSVFPGDYDSSKWGDPLML